jgi:TolB-like protein
MGDLSNRKVYKDCRSCASGGRALADVFISYARKDQALARRLAGALQARGLSVWWDDQLPAHRAYSDVIEQHLRQAKVAVVLWSADAAQSQWVRAEADLARSEGKLVQAQTDGVMPPMPFNQIQCADLRGWRGGKAHAGWQKLAASVEALVSGEEEERPVIARKPVPEWWRRPQALSLAAVALLIALVSAWLLLPRLSGDGSTERPVVAVLPFESLDRRDEGLVAGIWEDTRQALARNPQLLVLGPHSAEALAEKPPEFIRKAADFLIQASVRSVGDRVRVSTSLVRTDDGVQMWSESFDRRLDDVFALQQQIAGEIEGRIRGRLAQRGGTLPEHIVTSGEVYALYSTARTAIRKRQMERYDQAFRTLQEVVRRDPNFAPGWASLAVIQMFAPPSLAEQASRRPEADARRAIALAPNLAAAHAALGFVLQEGPIAQAALRRALELDPNDIEALNWLANSLDNAQVRDKLAIYSRIVEMEPLWWPAVFNKLAMLEQLNDPRLLSAELDRAEAGGDPVMGALVRYRILNGRGDLSEAASALLAAHTKGNPEELEILNRFLFEALIQLNLFDAADKAFPPPSPWVPLLRRNDPKAIDLIEESLTARSFWTFGPLPVVAGRVYLLTGQHARFAARYMEAAGSPQTFERLVGPPNLPDVVPSLALALRASGRDEDAGALLQRAEVAAGQLQGVTRDVALARIRAAQGRKDEALALLVGAVSRGWIPPYLPIHTDIALDPPLAEMKDDPRFQRLRQQILAHVAKERAELGPVMLQ